MKDRTMSRSWTIAAASAAAGAAALALGLFLAVSKDSLAEEKEKPKEKAKSVEVYSMSEGDDDDALITMDSGDSDSAGHKRGFLGLSLREDTKSDEGGAYIESVVHDSPAEKAGLKEGDVIVGYDGAVVRGPARVTEKIHAGKPGDKVTLDVRSGGKVHKIVLELGARKTSVWRLRSGDYAPMTEEQQKAFEESMKGLEEKMPDIHKQLGKMKFYAPGRRGFTIFNWNRPLLGVEMVDTTPELREALGGRKDAGVLVGKVLPNTAAERGGLKAGDLILSVEGEKVTDASELADAVNKNEGKTVDLEVVRDKRTMHVKAVLPKLNEPEDEPTGPRASIWRFAPPPVPPAAVVRTRTEV